MPGSTYCCPDRCRWIGPTHVYTHKLPNTVVSILQSMKQQQLPGVDVAAGASPLCSLPGDPSLVVFTNVSLGSKKPEFLKAASEAVAASLSKPESFVTVCIMVREQHTLRAPE